MKITGIENWKAPTHQPGQGILIHTKEGYVYAIEHRDRNTVTDHGIVCVWGAMGGFDGRSATIYCDLAEKFAPGITSVRVDYRDPRKFDTSVYDTLVGVSYLASTGHKRIALVGHSFGGGLW